MTTLVMFLLTSLFVVTATHGLRDDLDTTRLWGAVRLALCVVVLLSVAQAATGHLGSEALFNPFGAYQFQHQYNPHLEFVSVPRAHGFFLEPSYDAFVIGTLTVALLCRRDHFRSTLALALLGMAACQSATGLILILGIAFLIAIRSRPRISIPVTFGVALLLLSFGNYLISRLESIGNVGSSGNYRLIAPLQVLGDVLTAHPLGMPFGSIYEIISTYGLQMDGVEQTISLDNGIYVIVYYFGWIGLVAIGTLGVWALVSVFRRLRISEDREYDWIVPLWLFAALLFSGGIMAPEYGIMTWLIIVSFVESRRIRKGRINAAPTSPQYRHRYIR
ncbi:putative colanic acid polymerase WcaD [Micrococcaceae bacterium Sec5.7]